jgi:hypothetical protein
LNRVDLGFLWSFGTSFDIFGSRTVFFTTIQAELIVTMMLFSSGVKGAIFLVDDLSKIIPRKTEVCICIWKQLMF